jgi:hypothetical protein
MQQNIFLHPCVIHPAAFVAGHTKKYWFQENLTMPEVRREHIADEPGLGSSLADDIHASH